MRYQAVLFDFDGTLANDLGYFVKAYEYALGKYGIQLSDSEIATNCFNQKEETIAEKFGIPSGEEFRKYYFEGIKERFVDIPLFPGVINLLEELQKQEIKLGLISFARDWYIDMMLEQTKLKDYFQIIITFNDVTKPKPDPEAVIVACKKLQVPVNQALSIGDSRNDLLMGKTAGCNNALFLPKDNELYYDFDELRKLKPEYEFSDYKELSKIIKRD